MRPIHTHQPMILEYVHVVCSSNPYELENTVCAMGMRF